MSRGSRLLLLAACLPHLSLLRKSEEGLVYYSHHICFPPRSRTSSKMGYLDLILKVTELKQFVRSLTQKFSSSLNTTEAVLGREPMPKFSFVCKLCDFGV